MLSSWCGLNCVLFLLSDNTIKSPRVKVIGESPRGGLVHLVQNSCDTGRDN